MQDHYLCFIENVKSENRILYIYIFIYIYIYVCVCVCVCVCGFPYLAELVMNKGVKDVLNAGGLTIPGVFDFSG